MCLHRRSLLRISMLGMISMVNMVMVVILTYDHSNAAALSCQALER